MYEVKLKINDKIYNSKDNVLIDALEKLKPDFYKTKGIFTVKKGDKVVERLLFVRQMKRFFNNKITRIIISKLWDKALV